MNKLAKLIPHDKALHFVVGTVITSFGLLFDPKLAVLLVIAAAIGREAYNKYKGGKFDFEDIAWTVAPAFLLAVPKLV